MLYVALALIPHHDALITIYSWVDLHQLLKEALARCFTFLGGLENRDPYATEL
jgi:hypothetical protein